MRWLVLLGLALSATQAAASADGDVLLRSGLAGRWAEDCNAPPASGNWYDRYEVTAGGRVTETLYQDPNKIYRVSELHDLRMPAHNRVAYSMRDSDDEVLEIVVHIEKGRHRTWLSRTEKQTYIRDGKLQPEGKDTTWFNKCAD